jgi:hypothetical protein
MVFGLLGGAEPLDIVMILAILLTIGGVISRRHKGVFTRKRHNTIG